jgi:hypothetical protein
MTLSLCIRLDGWYPISFISSGANAQTEFRVLQARPFARGPLQAAQTYERARHMRCAPGHKQGHSVLIMGTEGEQSVAVENVDVERLPGGVHHRA